MYFVIILMIFFKYFLIYMWFELIVELNRWRYLHWNPPLPSSTTLINAVAIITTDPLKDPYRKRRESHRQETLTFKGLCSMTTDQRNSGGRWNVLSFIKDDLDNITGCGYRLSIASARADKKRKGKKYYTVRCEAISIGDARRVAFIEVFSKVYASRYSARRMHHHPRPPARCALRVSEGGDWQQQAAS